MKKAMLPQTLEWWSRWADIFAVIGLILGGIVALIAIIGWFFSWKAGKLKDEAFTAFQLQSQRAISEADAKAAEANKGAAIANQRTAELEKDAAEARLELERIKEKQRFRDLSQEQVQRMVSLVEDAPKGKIEVKVLQQDVEIGRYANQIREMLVEAGYNCGEMVAIGFGSSADPVGVIVLFSDQTKPPPTLNRLRDALERIGINPQLYVEPSLPKDQVTIIVGRKK